MKKFALFILLLLIATDILAQTTHIFRVCNSENSAKHIYPTIIVDSITHDFQQQVQMLYIGDDKYSYPLSEIDSISFSRENVIALLSNDYVEDSETYIFTNGIAMTVFDDSIYGHTIFVDSLDFRKKECVKDKILAMYCDSTYRPLIASVFGGYIQFSYSEDNSFSMIMTWSNGVITEYKDLDIPNNSSSRLSIPPKTSYNDGRWENINMGINILELAINVLKKMM